MAQCKWMVFDPQLNGFDPRLQNVCINKVRV